MVIVGVVNVSRMVVVVFQKKSADEIYSKRDASNADRLVEMNRQRNKETMDRFTGHEQCDHGKNDGAGKPAEDADFSSPKTVALAR